MSKPTTAKSPAGAAAEGAKNLRANEKKWGKPLMEAGWTLIPNTIIERQKVLGLDAVDLNILMHLWTHWWKAEDLPFLSKQTIAAAMGMSSRAIQRRIAAMEKQGLITRVRRHGPNKGTQTNLYRFDKLIAAATPYAHESLQERKRKQREQQERAGRKGRPRLVVSNP